MAQRPSGKVRRAFDLPARLAHRLRVVAAERGESQSELVERAVKAELDRIAREDWRYMPSIRWTIAADGAYEARLGSYRLEAWYATQGPREDWGWAWRVVGPSGLAEAEGPADDLEDAQRQATQALPVYVYRGRDDGAPQREAGPMSLAKAIQYIRERAVDQYGNLGHEVGCDYLYLADSEGRPLED